jgi:hypothetical protein
VPHAHDFAQDVFMSELVFERGLYATLAAALIVPELTTFLLFLLVMLSLANLLARLAWSCVWIPERSGADHFVPRPSERVTLHVVSVDLSASTAE